MPGYLEDYGVEDARRSKWLGWSIVALIAGVILATAGYFLFRTYPASHKVNVFLGELGKGDYQAAYRTWGCASPCRDYAFDKFLEDWGPQSSFRNPGAAEVAKTRYCETGVIVTLKAPQGPDVPLWYEMSDRSLGFSPWPVCAPRIPQPDAR